MFFGKFNNLIDWIGLCCCWIGYIEQGNAQSDTLQNLNEIRIYGIPLQKYGIGAKISRLDSLQFQLSQTRNLGELLTEQSAIYIKQYGNGMLGSISFRGTGAGHTTVLWNGININSMSLGESDFSNIPIQAIENLDIQAGSSSSLFGSDAIGGSIHLSSSPNWGKENHYIFRQTLGSFGLFSSNFNAQIGTRKWETKTKMYRTSLRNDFKFRNITIFGTPLETQQNAAFEQYGLIQEIAYRVAPNRYISLKGWYHWRNTQIQPTMGANDDETAYTVQEDENLRLVLDYFDNSRFGFWNLKMAYIQDDLLYNQNDRTRVNRWIATVQWDKKISEKWSFQAGTNWNYAATRVDNYEGQPSENRNDVYFSAQYLPSSKVRMSLNMRQSFVKGYQAPIAPSWGMEWKFWEKSSHHLSFKSLFSRSYRLPTLNMRFWNPGGNPTISPEKGWSGEIGLAYQLEKNQWKLQSEVTHFRMWVKDWIVWLPLGVVWAPQNIRNVQISGVEISGKLLYQIKNQKITISGNYAFNQSINQNGINEFDTQSVGKQLPFTPVHRGNFFLTYQYRQYFISNQLHYTGQRFTATDNIEKLPDFMLWNIQFGSNFSLNNSLFSWSFQLLNVLNTSYINYPLRAMPMRNYQITISCKI